MISKENQKKFKEQQAKNFLPIITDIINSKLALPKGLEPPTFRVEI